MKTVPGSTRSPPEMTVLKDTPPDSSEATEEKSRLAPFGPSEKVKPEVSQNRVDEVIIRSWGA